MPYSLWSCFIISDSYKWITKWFESSNFVLCTLVIFSHDENVWKLCARDACVCWLLCMIVWGISEVYLVREVGLGCKPVWSWECKTLYTDTKHYWQGGNTHKFELKLIFKLICKNAFNILVLNNNVVSFAFNILWQKNVFLKQGPFPVPLLLSLWLNLW